MRREQFFRMNPDEARALLAGAATIHLAADGPIFRTVNFALADGAIAFHGSPVGEKLDAVGREVVLSVEDPVAVLPSYFMDPERACPATTLYRSVQVHGTLEEVDDLDEKARALQALMEKYQPEGGHVEIRASDPLYTKAVAGVMVLRVSLERVDGKSKLMQNRRAEEVAHVLEQLWKRGAPGDARAIDLIGRANPAARPKFLACPSGARLLCAPARADEAAALLRDAYWSAGVSPETIARAHVNASAWVCAVDDEGRMVATARAISDNAKYAGVFDVMVAPGWRGRGLGDAVVRLLLDHPSVRGARRVWLGTKDAQDFYARLGFREGRMLPLRAYVTTEMVLDRHL